ncbi:MAG: hypothetical protein K2X62_16655 [Beijerinckiaceae bacterium]|jgi:hypothetical protein|nr:hypothetical protein [Beijerinckiaceae bacterium]MDO9439336.1 hypothetical protein [Beijerinckiaceae bacterium]
MTDWVSFDQWANCSGMEKPGYVFEVANAEGKTLLTPCDPKLQKPWDWASGPVRFRLVPQGKPRRSDPIPPPQQR